jgi:hypothetical protein
VVVRPAPPRGAPGGGGAVERGEFRVVQHQVGGRDAVADGLGPRRPRDGQHVRPLGQHPGQADLLRAHSARLGDLGERGVPVGQPGRLGDAAQRAPRQEGRAQLGAQLQLRLAGPEGGRVLVLHRRQAPAEHPVGGPDLPRVGVGHARQPDLARVEQLGQGAHGLLERHLGVGAVELVEPDRLHAEPAQGRVARPLQVLRAAVERPRPVARTRVAALGRHQHLGGVAAVGRQRLGDEQFVVPGVGGVEVVGVGRVDQGHAGVEGGVHGRDRTLPVGAALDGQGHAAQADRADGPVADGSLLHAADSLLRWVGDRAGAPGGAPHPA